MSLRDVGFAGRYREAVRLTNRPERTPSCWRRRTAAMSAARASRPCAPLPDYLSVVGIFHQRGIHPRLDDLSDASRFAGGASVDDFLVKAHELAGDLSPDDGERLRKCFVACGDRLAREPMRWAFIWWDVDGVAAAGTA
ncbi:MAG: hypothetical protein MUE61_10880 [Vicinamibacterales bacterium]|jgi:hypothetical protein|nr:hypothetical protein [Vicinamibacterales bacterium]